MRYKLDVSWNGTKVLTAECTATMAHSIIQGGFQEFTEQTRHRFLHAVPSLDEIHNAAMGTQWSGEFGDETGIFQFCLTKVKE